MDEDCCEKLYSEKAKVFHNLVAKRTLYTTKRARRDTCTAIAFLTTTRVRAPDKDDWAKLCHLMVQYL
jgi:hypothetical protein